jgi:hypothetical protein
MFMALLGVMFAISLAVVFFAVQIFKNPISSILKKLIVDDIYVAWARYIKFAMYVVGLSGGVRVWSLEKYFVQQDKDAIIMELTKDRWVLEIYRAVTGTLQGITWMLLVFFVGALIAYVITRIFQSKNHQEKA